MRSRQWQDRLAVSGALTVLLAGCTVKAVGDPNRPITINAHVIIDIRGLEKTATGIEDYVSGDKPIEEIKKPQGGQS